MKYFEGIGKNCGKYVKGEDAMDYAMEQCGYPVEKYPWKNRADHMEFLSEFEEQIVEWYFSGDWKLMDKEPPYVVWD